MTILRRLLLPALLGLFGVIPGVTQAQSTVFYGPLPYLDFNGTKPAAGTNYSPFADMLFTWFYLETFEEGALTTPGVTNSWGEVQGASIYTDSVDGDDGSINGSGLTGHSMHVTTNTVVFTFNKTALGNWPTHAGVVWTDVGYRAFPQSYYGHVVLEAFGPDGNSLGTNGPVAVGDGLDGGQSGEDRFFGVSDSRGISAISFTMPDSTDWELDHLQYGRQASIVGQAAASIRMSATNSGVVEIRWPSQVGTNYQVLWTPQLGTGTNVWRAMGLWAPGVDTNLNRNVGGAIAGNGSTNVVTALTAGSVGRFFRVVPVQ
jgi:hypothetical protein